MEIRRFLYALIVMEVAGAIGGVLRWAFYGWMYKTTGAHPNYIRNVGLLLVFWAVLGAPVSAAWVSLKAIKRHK